MPLSTIGPESAADDENVIAKDYERWQTKPGVRIWGLDLRCRCSSPWVVSPLRTCGLAENPGAGAQKRGRWPLVSQRPPS